MNMNYNINDVPSDLRDRLSALVDRLETKERHMRFQRRGIAASILLLLVSGTTWMMVDNTPTHPQTIPSDLTPEQASKEAERALMIFAQAVKRGQDGVKEAEKTTREVTQNAFETLKKYSQ